MRRFILPLILIALALGAAGAAYAIEQEDEAESTVAASSEHPVTPLLSPRRVPLWLLQPGGDALLRLGLQPVIDQSPVDTCLNVTDRGRVIVDQRPELGVVPASNQKIVTSFAAQEVLGDDYTFTTTAVAGAAPVDGVINGDLWIVGGGDPVISTGDFLEGFEETPANTSLGKFAQAIADAGVIAITGDVLGDDSRYDGVDTVPDWPDRDYGTAVPGHLDALLVNRGYSSYAVDPDETVVPQPATDAAAAFAERMVDALESKGVDVQGGPAAGIAPAERVEVAAIESPPLAKILPVINELSDNTVSELLVKEMAVAEGRPGSTVDGLEVLRAALTNAGIDLEGIVIADGSGLHNANRLSCPMLAAILEQAGPDSTLADSMAVAGESGTLADRLEGPVAGRIRAKTGSLLETTALSGYADTVVGYDLVFSYVANAPEVPEEQLLELQELLASVLVRYPEGPSPAEVDPLTEAPDPAPTTPPTTVPVSAPPTSATL